MKLLLLLAVSMMMLHAAGKKKEVVEIVNETYVLGAMDAQARQKFELASHYFEHLYAKTGNKEYLYHSLRMYESGNDVSKLSSAIQAALSKMPEDKVLQRFHIIALLKEGKYSEADKEALLLSEETKSSSDYLLSAEALLKLSNYQGAYAALKKSYEITFNEETAERMALIQYAYLDQKQEAIRFLKEHIRVRGNSKLIGKRLGSFYGDSGELDDAAAMYEETYTLTADPLIAQEAVKIYLYQQDASKLRRLLEKSGVNDPMLLELYVRDKQFKEGSELAKKIYEEDKNPLFLAQSAVFAYEASTDRNDPVLLRNVIDDLKQANEEMEEPLYLNYLGYLMIDHDMDVDEGIGYVKKALLKQPDSPFYLDSLAWGYYKKGECTDALKLMKQVESMLGTEDDEVKKHLEAIETCKPKEKE